jgi:uncharacterized protein DUF4384
VNRTRTGRLFAVVAAAFVAAASAGTSRAAVQVDASILVEPAARVSRVDVDVWTNKEEGGVYRQGEPMRVLFRTSTDAFVLIYNIDTEGYIHLVYPYGPEDPDRIEGGVTYQVPSRHDPYELVADGPAGVEYVVAIASPFPFRDLPWYLRGRYEGDEDDYGRDDDEGESGVIAGDPYVGMDRVIRRVVPPGQEDEVATDDTYFYIERRVEYPRYVCADCHSYGGWYDPYVDVCTVVDIRIDAGWARFRPLRSRVLRPRYFYMVRSTAPSRYRQWKDRWSSVDGRSTLRTRFQVDGQDKFRSRRETIQRRTPPEFQNLRRPRSGRVWKSPDEVLRRDRERTDARVRERANDRSGDRSTWQREREMRNRDDAAARQRREEAIRNRDEARRRDEGRRDETRRREWRDREQRRNEQRQMQERRRNEQRESQERRRGEERSVRERRDSERRDQAARERRDNERRDNERREGRANRDRGRSEDKDRGDRGRDNDDRRRDDRDRDRGRGRDRGR